MLNNRELAILLWGAVFLLSTVARSRTRPGAMCIFHAAVRPQILIPLAAMAGWVVLEASLVRRVTPWNSDLTKGVVVWFVTAGILLFGKFEEASKDPHFFAHEAIETLAWPALAEFYLDLYHLPLLLEIVLQPVVVILAVVPILTARDEWHRQIKRLTQGLGALAGLALFAFVAFKIVRGWDTIDKSGLLLEFALPVWLTLGALPFIYVLAVYGAYEMAFLRLKYAGVNEAQCARNRLAILAGLRLRPREVSGITPDWLHDVALAPTFREAYGVVRRYRTDRSRAARNEAEEKKRQRRFAGIAGVDSDNRQLDRREFRETMDSLRWLSVCMRSRYRRDRRYRPTEIESLEGTFTRYDLKGPSGIQIRVAQDGRSWYGWRRTITGWCFAIGADGPPPDEWFYDGQQPPIGFPGSDLTWGDSRTSQAACRNWDEQVQD